MSEILAVGVSHNTAPVDVRERLALPRHRADELMRDVRADAEVREAVAVFTCNRTELYMVVPDPVAAEAAVLGWLARRADIPPTELAASIFVLRRDAASRHLFRVTAGLDSAIIGEAEVQGQVKRAFEEAMARGMTGPLSNQLLRAALTTGKRVRAETRVAERHLSVPSLAVNLAREQLGDLAAREVVILGAGETSELTARALAQQGATAVLVANRRYERAHVLARRFGGRAIGFEGLPEALARVDIVLAATSSPRPMIEVEELAQVMSWRDGRPLMLFDLAVPRDIHPDCGELDGVALYNVDDLQAMASRNRSLREGEAHQAERIVEDEVRRFEVWLEAREVVPTVAALRRHGDRVASHVIAENSGRWESLSARDQERVEAMARSIVKRLLHEPIHKIKGNQGVDVQARMELVRELFDIQ
jgi:glutamyl-tRNA reductase